MAPIIGGDGSLEKAAVAIARSVADVESVVGLDLHVRPPTKLEILSPTLDTFANWGEESLEFANRRVIPNSHLRHQGSEVRGGVTLQDANLLKVEVTHGVELKVPVVSKLLAEAMLILDDNPDHRLYYLSNRFPLKSSATVRMQSEAWEGAIREAAEKPYGEQVARLSDIADQIEEAAVEAINNFGDDDDEENSCDEHGLSPSFAELVATGEICLAPGYELTADDYEREPCNASFSG